MVMTWQAGDVAVSCEAGKCKEIAALQTIKENHERQVSSAQITPPSQCSTYPPKKITQNEANRTPPPKKQKTERGKKEEEKEDGKRG